MKYITFKSGPFGFTVNHCLFLSLVSLGCLSFNAQAQDFMPSNALGRAGITENNQRVGQAVQAVCGGFVMNGAAAGIDPNAPNAAAQMELFATCGEMVHTANRLEDNGGPVARDLGVGIIGLNSALQNAAGEEAAAVSSLATETASSQTSAVTNRMAALLSSSSTLKIGAASILGQHAIVIADKDEAFVLRSGGSAAAGDELASKLGFYANLAGAVTDRSSSNDEDGFTATGSGFVLGADYMISDGLVLGAAFGFSSSTTDFRLSDFVAGGSLDSEQTNITGYGLWFNDNKYVNVVVGFGSGDVDLERRIVVQATEETIAEGVINGLNETANSSTENEETRFSLGAGIETSAGRFTIAPFGRISYLDLAIDGYQETGSALSLLVRGQDVDSITSSLGFRLVASYSNQVAVILPQFSFEWVHEFSDDERQIVSTYVNDPRQNALVIVTDEPDRNYFIAGLSASAVFRNGIQAYADIKGLLDLDNTHQTAFTVGARYEF